MVKILHAADFHLDSPFRALTPEQARQRRGEGRDAMMRLASFANAGDVDLVLLAGDLFDRGEIYRETAQMLPRALGEIHGRVFIAPGNHDYWEPSGPYGSLNWPGNVHIFKSEAIEAVEIPEKNCVVYGAAFTAPECTEDLLAEFRVPEDDGRLHLMVLHADVEGGGRYRPIKKGEIAESGLDYLALGHVHAYSGIQKLWNTTWAYPGCPEGRGFDECGRRGVIMGTVDKGGADLHFVTFCRRKYEILNVDVSGRDALEAVEDTLGDTAAATDVYRIVLTGEAEEGGVDTARVQRALEERFYRLEVRDETRPARDLWAYAGEDSLRGLFLRRLRARAEGAQTEEERLRVDRAARFGLAALENREL